MFGISSGVNEDEDLSDNSSVPMSYQHFNPSVRPKSKLGRRRLMQPKETKNVEEASKQGTQPPTKPSHWPKDDSGIFPSESTPSLTQSSSRVGNTNFNAKLGAGPFTSAFTPSYIRSDQENKFNKFALPSTPRFRSEPLREINGMSNSAHQLGNDAVASINPFSYLIPSKEVGSSQEVSIQKQLNSSFISDESLPLGSNAANKTANETSDFSNDSSFMTCHDVNIQQSNKTVYDPAFLKTPGRNLAEIRIDESPFNPLENFLEESDDFGVRKAPASSLGNNESKIKVSGPNETANVDESRYSDPLAFPLDCSNIEGSNKEDGSSLRSPLKPSHSKPLQATQFEQSDMENGCEVRIGEQDGETGPPDIISLAYPTDSEFKRPTLAFLKTPHRTEFDKKREMREHTTPSSGYIPEKSFHTEETTHVTYPQPSKSILGQKNTFTSQFSLSSYNPIISNNVKALSLANRGYEPLCATSLRNTHGAMSSHFDQGYGSQSGRMVHRMGNVRDSSSGVEGLLLPSTEQCLQNSACSFDQIDELDSTVNSVTSGRTVVARHIGEPRPGGGAINGHNDDIHASGASSNQECNVTVVSRDSHLRANQQRWQGPNRPVPSNHLLQNNQQPAQAQQNGVHPFAQQQQSKLPSSGQRLPNQPQYDGQHQSGLYAGGVQNQNCQPHGSRPQFGGQQLNKLQKEVHQDPQRPHFSDHHQSSSQSANCLQNRPQSASRTPSVDAVSAPPSGNPVLSALIKPEPQNLIKVKGTPYTVLSLIGKGGSSQVYQALGPQSSKLMAIKCVDLSSVEEAMATDYLNEIGLLSKLQGCPSVIKMFDHEYVERTQMLYVVLEKGDIDFSKLIKNISENNQISMPMILYYWSEMLNAVHEIHKRGIIHSDLKPANFLLVEGRLKLIDFGIASSIQGDTTSVMKDVPAGTYNYMSPESIRGPKITRKSDVWSMGCILFNLLYGRTPFSHLNNRWQKLHAIADMNHPVTFPPLKHHPPPSLRLALRWCLIKDPALRPTVEELVTLSDLSPPADSGLGKEIDGMMCQYFRRVLPNLRNLKEDV